MGFGVKEQRNVFDTLIDGIRRIGNIGAHMEKDINLIVDIDPDEAQKLIKLIEHLLEQWYVNRHEQELLYTDIIDIDKYAKELENMGFGVKEQRNVFDTLCGYDIKWQ